VEKRELHRDVLFNETKVRDTLRLTKRPDQRSSPSRLRQNRPETVTGASNHMNSADSSEALWLATLSGNDRIRFMVLLAHGLTIGQRVLCYDKNVEGVRQLNEAHHQVAGLLVDHFDGRTRPAFEPHVFKLTDAQARIQGDQAWAYAKSHFGT
ncbi:hypothetical protein M2282_006200, partial [Variovorax boronicumulans]|uniref:hypothetical protein n=1 Tax=Variovorax boronicumulans TaxID=436515 RepID=UPI002474E0DF